MICKDAAGKAILPVTQAFITVTENWHNFAI
jgi:hypothetical protein